MRNIWLEKSFSRCPRVLNILHRFRLVEAISQTNEAELRALGNYASGFQLALEIGSFQGVSAVRIASKMSAEAILYCIDPWPNRDSHPNPCLQIFERYTHRAQISHKLKIIRDVSENVLHELPAGLDFIFVDGDHSLSPLRTDSLPLVSKIYWRESADNAIIDAP